MAESVGRHCRRGRHRRTRTGRRFNVGPPLRWLRASRLALAGPGPGSRIGLDGHLRSRPAPTAQSRRHESPSRLDPGRHLCRQRHLRLASPRRARGVHRVHLPPVQPSRHRPSRRRLGPGGVRHRVVRRLAGGAVTSGSSTAALLGLGGAVVSLLPSVCVLAALRYRSVRGLLNRLLDRLIAISRQLVRRPGPGAEDFLEQFLDRVASLKLPTLQYAEVFALALWNWVGDCLCLACAIRATGSNVPWQGLFLAYGAGMTAGSIGLTPGGLGIVEAALSAALVAAGIRGGHAFAAVLVYRLISFWLVMAGGWAIMAVLTRNTRITQVANRPSATGTTTHRRWATSLRARSPRP
ncbi:MAG: UPF0104 family protein [Actinobacteria bacterium]|nr:MAG: UPF0104 family protein [Actinomycetota bacterium]